MLTSIKALTILQPWASAIACGAKRIETRSWATKYRGLLLIHAGKGQPPQPIFVEACRAAGLRSNPGESCCLPLGALIAVAELVDCLPTMHLARNGVFFTGRPDVTGRMTDQERALGNYIPDRYGWVLANVRRLPTPIPYRGRQGLFNITEPDALDAEMTSMDEDARNIWKGFHGGITDAN
jgi:hypothetical protein